MDTHRQRWILVLVTDTPESMTEALGLRADSPEPEEEDPALCADPLRRSAGASGQRTDVSGQRTAALHKVPAGERNVFWTTVGLFERSFAGWVQDGVLQTVETAVVTDSPAAALFCRRNRIACAGYQKEKGSGFFPDVSLVFEENGPLDMEELDRLRRRTYGLPVTAVQTEHLLLREMCSKDFESWKEAWKEDIRDTGLSEKAAFEAYVQTSYSFYEYGYWAVQHRDEKQPVIGFCGFRPYGPEKTSKNPAEKNRCTLWLYKQEEEPFSVKEDMPESGTESMPGDLEEEQVILELGYVLLPVWRGAGLGTQMCQAAISYAFRELGASALVCRIRKDNRKSLALAARLGFHPAGPGAAGCFGPVQK